MKKIGLNLKDIADTVEISDGYHTFDELYEHRIALYIALCKSIQRNRYYGDERNHVPEKIAGDMLVWRSQLHSDGSNYDGWFILGIDDRKGKQITYHLPNEKWEETEFAQTLKKAPKFDGHTSEDVLKRLSDLLN